MNSDNQEKSGESSAMDGWMKSAMDFWLDMVSGRSDMPGSGRDSSDSATDDFATRMRETWQQPFKVFLNFLSTFNDAEGFNAFVAGSGAIPDIMMRLLRSGWDGYSRLCQQWMQKVGKSDSSGEPYRFENLDRDMFKVWTEFYQKEIQPVLGVPQLGLYRVYQEKMYQTIDKYNLHQTALAEFMQLLYLPFEKSIRVVEKEIEQLSEEGKLSGNFKDYYQMWIKVLEGHYMTLFQSSDYLDSMTRMLSTLGDFKMAQHKILEDSLQALPIPTNKEMDELYKEIYLLKKKVNQLSNKEEEPEFPAS